MIRWLSLLLVLAACAAPPPTTSDPLLFKPDRVARAQSVIIAVPGALTPVLVLSGLETLATADRAVVYYRLPGFDGRPADEVIDLDFAANHIAAFVAENGFQAVYIVGHSTGAAIAMEAAGRIKETDPMLPVQIAAISSALPAPQPTLAGLRGAGGTAAAAFRARSLDPRTVWLEYYRTLAYGRGAQDRAEVAAAADKLVAANEGRIEIPEDGLARRHWRAVRRWPGPDPDTLRGVPITFLHGAGDPVFPLRALGRFAKRLPDARVEAIPDSGHLLLLTRPTIWADINRILGF